ncbi:unnamed protein product [Arabidopsis thaliana]|uniref:Formin-like protein n=1 Tax=Arabidopsis thaliana TaxID=3702 RepID=A0A7G2FBZ3_ARATH|nr:unnamed protein product [Arabidopsis thaliana]
MALFRRFFYKKPPDRLLEISERVYVFDCCFSSDVMGEDEYKVYLGGIVAQLQDHFPEASFMVFNFREGEQRSQISDVLSQYDMTVMDYPRQYESCPLLPLEMIHHFLRSSESWLSLEGQQNVLLMHCERGGWPVLAFMLSGLLLYRKQYHGEQKTLEMVHKQAPKELLHLLSPLNPQPSQLRYLQYISRRNLGSDWPPSDTPLLLDCLILRDLPHFEGKKGCRPILRVYGQDPKARTNRSSILLFSTLKTKKHTRLYQQEECILVKLDIQCRVQGDVVLECIHLHDDLVSEEMVFRIMFHTAFVRANILMLQRDEMDILWDVKDQFPKEFKAEVLFSGADAVVPPITTSTLSDDENDFDMTSPEEFFEVEEIFSDVIDGPDHKRDSDSFVVVNTASDDSEGKEVWKGDVEPNAFLDCASDDSNHKHDMHAETSTDPVKDITVDDVQYRSDGKADSNIDSVKDIGIDDGDEQRKRRTVEAKENDSSTVQTQSKGDEESNDLESMSQKTNTSLNKPISEKPQATLRKQVGANAKPAAAGDSLKPKSKQQETQGPNVRMAKPNAVSRWIPSNKGSYKDSMHVAYPPTRINSAPASITTSLKDGKRATSPDGVIPKDAKTKYLRASVSSPDMRSRAPICSSPDSSPKETPSSLPPASPHQAPPPLPSLTSEAKTVLHSSQAVASPPPPPPPPPLPTYSHYQTSQLPPPPPPPPPFSSERPNSGTVLPPPPPPPPPFSSERPNSGTVLPPPPPPPLPFPSERPNSGTVLPPPPSPPWKSVYASALAIPAICSTSQAPTSSPTPPPPPPAYYSVGQKSSDLQTSQLPSPPPPPPPPPFASVRRNSETLLPPPPPPPPPPWKSLPPGGGPPPPPMLGARGAAVDPRGAGRGRGLPRPGFGSAAQKKSSLKPLHWVKVTRALQGSLWDELQRHGESQTPSEFDVSEIETLFSATVQKPADKSGSRRKSVGAKPEKVQLIDLRRANNTEIMLTKVKMPLPDMMAAVLAMDESVLDNYTGDKTTLGKCEQYFLELMKVPRVEAKLRVFSFKFQFGTQITEFKKSLNAVNSACEEVRSSQKLKEIMKKILYLGNTLNQGTARGAAVGFKLDSLSKLSDTRAANSKMTLMHYLCKVLASKASVLLDFPKDLESLESASKIQLKSLAEEMQAIIKGLEKLNQELTASESDGPVSDVFRKTLGDFISVAETEVATVSSLYSVVGRNADALAHYFGEDPNRCPFEQVTATLLNFIRLFKKAHEENVKQAELEKKKALKEAEMEKAKGVNLTKKPQRGGGAVQVNLSAKRHWMLSAVKKTGSGPMGSGFAWRGLSRNHRKIKRQQIQLKLAEDEDHYCEQHLICPLDHSSSMVVIRESPIFAKDDGVVFPPIYHENLHVASSVYGVDRYLESPSESSSPSSSSRRSGSSSSFSLFPSDSDGQTSLTAFEFDRKAPSETEEKSLPLLLSGESPPSDSGEQSPFEQISPRLPSEQGGKSPPCDSDGKLLGKPLNREVDVLHDWWEPLLVRLYSKLKNLLTWFSKTIRSFYPVLAIAIWWWMRVRARRKRVKGENMDHLRDVIKERDERIVQLLHQLAQMNELLLKHHKDIVSRRR